MTGGAGAQAPIRIVDHQASAQLEVEWLDGARHLLSHARLRQACRCAACAAATRRGQAPPDPPPDLRLVGLVPVGLHGLNLQFSDGHDRGIYPWTLLRELSAA